MSKIVITPLDRVDIAPQDDLSEISFATELLHRLARRRGGLTPAEGEYWFDGDEVERWLDDGVFYLVSPLDTANMTEVELSEEQEDFLGWLKSTGVRHVRVVE